jgi:protein involved in polysaccharide export with SLBB domain
MNVFCFFMVISLVFIQQARAQEVQDIQQAQAQIIQLALTSPSYKVTAGDVYTLTYGEVKNVITVDYSYRLSIPGVGIINGADKTYHQIKSEIENIVTYKSPQSGAQFILTTPSSFSVYIKGEVRNAAERTTWAMGRLSSLLNGILTEYSSTRNVTVTSTNGQVKTYDLFKAQRSGDLSEDPYLRPGDTITISHLDRKVSVFGEVERSGTYELLPGENIQELIRNYANGYTSRAAADRIELTRYAGDNRNEGNTIYLTEEEIDANYPLQNFDAVYIPIRFPL